MAAPAFGRVDTVLPDLCFDLVQHADQHDELPDELARPPAIFGESPPDLMGFPPAVRPAVQAHQGMGVGYNVVDLVVVAHKHRALAHAGVQRRRRLRPYRNISGCSQLATAACRASSPHPEDNSRVQSHAALTPSRACAVRSSIRTTSVRRLSLHDNF